MNCLDRFFEKYSIIKFHENPSSGSRVVSCARTDGQTDMNKLIVSFRNFANGPIKPNYSDVFRLILSHSQAVQDFMYRKMREIYAYLPLHVPIQMVHL